MSILFVLRITAVLLVIVSGFMLVPIGVAVFAQEWVVIPSFLIPMGASVMLLGLVLVLRRRPGAVSLSVRDSYLFVSLSWILAAVLGAAPLVLSGAVPRLVDAYFEIMSGFTTTGATVIPDVEILPRSILMWRSLTHWLGGGRGPRETCS